MTSLIEFSHRFMVIIISILLLACVAVALNSFRASPRIVWSALVSVPLVFGQALLGGIVVATELNPWWVTAHFAVALALVADVMYLAVNSFFPSWKPSSLANLGFAKLARWTTATTGALLLVGTYVRATGTGAAIRDWPLMQGRLVPLLGSTTTPMFAHRVLAALAFLLVIFVLIRSRTEATRQPAPIRQLALLVVLLFVGQILVGAANVWTGVSSWLWVTLHVAMSVLIWSSLIILTTLAYRLAPQVDEAVATEGSEASAKPSLKDTASAYFQLTKPRIIVLLLITTIPAMILAAGRVPSIWLMAATLLGGMLAAGSANAINCYLDRDIDAKMHRTQSRPLPAHQVTPEDALRFGYILGAISFYFLSITVNVLAATLALSAIVFYVFVYTLWLKRSTDQNIVIGGAAGAVPVLVGWAAVTGTVGMPAIILFAIIFVWTPPHFWALAMRFKEDYAAAGVPMMPVVRTQDQTLWQIVVYTLVLFLVTLVLVPVADLGIVYLSAAVILGGMFTYKALKLRQHYSEAATMKVFKFSILYLGLLFLAVALDPLLTN